MMEKKRKIAIWTTLQFNNYGDDLQAIALAIDLKNNGNVPIVYCLNERLANLFHIETTTDIDYLLRDAKVCLIAGGGQLIKLNILKRHLHKAYSNWEKMFKPLVQTVEKYNVKCWVVSIGGSGELVNPRCFFGYWRRKFFGMQQMAGGTVRLPIDAKQMEIFDKSCPYYPDMLFRVLDYFTPQKLPSSSKIRVGLNFKKGKYLSESLIANLLDYAQKNNDIEFHFLTTHTIGAGLDYQYLPPIESPNLIIDRYDNPNQLLGVLASMDVVVSSMLHIGLTSLTLGTPFVSYRGPGKTKSFLQSVEANWAILDDEISFDQLLTRYIKIGKQKLYAKYNLVSLEKCIKDSQMHFDAYKKYLNQGQGKF